MNAWRLKSHIDLRWCHSVDMRWRTQSSVWYPGDSAASFWSFSLFLKIKFLQLSTLSDQAVTGATASMAHTLDHCHIPGRSDSVIPPKTGEIVLGLHNNEPVSNHFDYVTCICLDNPIFRGVWVVNPQPISSEFTSGSSRSLSTWMARNAPLSHSPHLMIMSLSTTWVALVNSKLEMYAITLLHLSRGYGW